MNRLFQRTLSILAASAVMLCSMTPSASVLAGGPAEDGPYFVRQGVLPEDALVKPTVSLSQIMLSSDNLPENKQVTVNLCVTGADGKYSDTCFHIKYSERLTPVLRDGEAAQLGSGQTLSGTAELSGEYLILTTDGEAGEGKDGILWKMTFRLPDDAATGDAFPVSIAYVRNDYENYDRFNNDGADPDNSRMSAWVFTEGVEQGWIRIARTNCAVSFDANTGSGTQSKKLVKAGQSFELPECTFTQPAGMTFAGWSLNGKLCAPGEWVSVSWHETFKAEWKGEGTLTENLKWYFNSFTGALTLKGYGPMPDYEKRADRPWAEVAQLITQLELPDGLRSIGSNAFSATNIRSVQIPEAVLSIGEYAFSACTSLAKINLPYRLESMGRGCFTGCTNLGGTVELPYDLNAVPEGAFSMTGINSCVVPESVGSVGRSAFGYCQRLKEIYILNPDCEIYDDVSTICDRLEPDSDTHNYFKGTVYGYTGSTAEAYTNQYNISFEPVRYAVSYKANGGIGDEPDDDYAETVTLPENPFEAPEGMRFAGWLVEEKIAQPGETVRLTDTAVIEAQWEPALCTVSTQDIVGSPSLLATVRADSEYFLPANCYDPPFDGVEFGGWTVQMKDSAFVLQPGESLVISADTVLTPDWVPITYDIIFDGNGAENEMTGKTVEAGTKYKLPKNKFTVPEGMQFTGWVVNYDWDVICQPGDTLIINEDTYILPNWEPVPETVFMGDVNYDGAVDTEDAMILMRWVNNWPDAGIFEPASDLNGDGEISTADALILSRYVNGWEGYDSYIVTLALDTEE